MQLPQLTSERTIRTVKTVMLTEEQVKAILTDWARTNYGLERPEIDFDCESFGIRECEIREASERHETDPQT